MKTVECKYCLSEIPEKALKCKYCLEFQNKVEISNSPEEKPKTNRLIVDYSKLKVPFQLKMVKTKHLPYPAVIFVIGVLMFAIIQFLWYRLDEDKIYLLSFLSFTIQMIISWACLIWIYNVINVNYDYFVKISSYKKEEAEAKFYDFNKRIFNNKKAILIGVFVGLFASVGDYIIGTPFKSIEAKFIFAGFEFINMFFAGAAVYSMMIFAYFLHHLTVSPKQTIMTINQKRSIGKIGSIHLKTSVLAIFPFLLGVVAKLFGDWSWEFLVIMWYLVFAIAIIVYIYWPMWNVHNYMDFDMENQLSIVQEKIRSKLSEIKIDPSSSNFAKLNELRALESSISGQNTWPFSTKSLSAVFAALIAPIILMLIDKFWSI